MKIIGYFLFVFITIIGAPIIVLILSPIILPIAGILFSAESRLRSNSDQKAISGILGGIFAGCYLFFVALFINYVFGSNPFWLIGIGIGMTLFAAPKIKNSKIAVPFGIITIFVLSYFLLL